jgi:hypothetical protein
MKPVARNGNYCFRRVRQFVTFEITENNLSMRIIAREAYKLCVR